MSLNRTSDKFYCQLNNLPIVNFDFLSSSFSLIFIFFILIYPSLIPEKYNRKDSFITHRAFCDALAEESARFTSLPTAANLNNLRNQSLNGGISVNLQQMNGNISQFGSLFRPELMGFGSLDSSSQLNLDGQKQRLPLWLHHDNANSGKRIGSSEFIIYIYVKITKSIMLHYYYVSRIFQNCSLIGIRCLKNSVF